MEIFATAGGAGQAMDVVPLCGCWFGIPLVALLAVVSVAKRSYWFAGAAILCAAFQAAFATDAVVKFEPSDDPDESYVEGLVWRLAFWAAMQVVIALAALVVVTVRRRNQQLESPKPFPDTGSPEGATGNSQG